MPRVALALLLSLAGASGLAQADELANRLRARFPDGVLRWAGDAEGGAPYQFLDPDDPDKVIGYEVEIADALAEIIGRRMDAPLRAEFVQYKWVNLRPGLDKGDYDLFLSGYEIAPDTAAGVLFARPYYIYAQQLVVRRDEREIEEVADCLNKRVGTLSGSAAERYLQEAGVEKVVGYEGQVEPYRDLELGRVDAVLLDTPITTYYALPNPKLKFVGPRMAHGEYGIPVRLEDADLRDALDEALGELMVSGRLAEILRKWNLWNADQAQLARGNAAELAGLGFDADGLPLAASLIAGGGVDVNVLRNTAERWTFDRYAPLLLKAAGMTVFLTCTSMALAMTIGLAVSLCRMYGPAPLRWAALGYIEFFRGIPLLLLLTFLYYGVMPVFDEVLNPLLPDWFTIGMLTAILGFGLNYAAYEAEIYRSAIQSVPLGQWEAGRALGMSEPLCFRRIIFPQAFRTALGPMTNDFVAMFKDTSLVSVIAVAELTGKYSILSRSSLKFVEMGILTAALYLAMSVPLGYLSRWLEHRWGPAK
jgi:polar amino acid transport system substrate-binding protein